MATPETDEGLDAPERFSIKRDQSRDRTIRFAAGEKEKLCADPIVVDDMRSL